MEHETVSRGLRESRTHVVAYVGIAVALIAVCSWVIVPIGPIPLTLQMFAIPLIICVLPLRWSIVAVCSFILLGLLGVPVFSGFRGGIGVLLGPTGGYLLGYIPGVVIGACIVMVGKHRWADRKAPLFACEVFGGIAFTLIAYVTGWIQYAAVAGVSLEASFLVSVAPFIVPDLIKVIAAVACAQPITAALKASA